ncbi:MAG: hypothetical protein NTZ73_04270 [Candidatus Diapherotrites archaeon]|nr:hypothetical protein [Candidatus Diapherotrites archaeon]
MKKKGFIFSIEALLSIIVTVAAISIIGGALINSQTAHANFLETNVGSSAAMGVYFGDANRLAVGNESNVVCKTIADYNSTSKNVFERKFCGEIK